jgi:hypothetical protein
MASLIERLTPARESIVDAAATAVLVSLALVGFRSSYGGYEFLVIGVIGVLLGLVAAHLFVVFRPPLLVGLIVLAVGYLVIGGAVSLRSYAIAGFVPSVASIRGAGHAAVHGWKELITTAPPVTGVGVLMALPFLCGYAGAFATNALMRRARRRSLGLLPVFAVFGIAVATGLRDRPASLIAQGAVLAAAVLGWLAIHEYRSRPRLAGSHVRRSRLGSAAGVLAVAAGAGWLLAPLLPLAAKPDRKVLRYSVVPPFDPRVYPSPLSAYREYVKSAELKDKTLFTIEGLPPNTLVRLSTMDKYDGLVWRPSFQTHAPLNPSSKGNGTSSASSGYFERLGTEITSDYKGTIATVTVTIKAYGDVWVPDVGEVLSLRFSGGKRDRELNDAFRYNRATDTAASMLPLHEGDRYVMRVRLPPAPAKLAGQPVIPDAPVGEFSQVGTLDKWAATPEVLGLPGDPGGQVDVLANRLRTEGSYSDGDGARGQLPSVAGHSVFRLNTFITEVAPVGNAEQYASALALMLRGLSKLPSRVVMGFLPTATTAGTVEVKGSQVEAWVELPVKDIGWVPVLPTPPRTDVALKKQSPTPPEPDYKTQVPPPPPVLDPEFDQPATSKTGAKDTKNEGEKPKPATNAKARSVPRWVAAAGIVAGGPIIVLGLALLAITTLKGRRRKRRRERGDPHERIANGWRELADGAVDMGRPVPGTSTRREAAQFVGHSVESLAQRADYAIFGSTEVLNVDVDEYWDDLEKMMATMRQGIGPIGRLRARLNLSSFRLGSRQSTRKKK